MPPPRSASCSRRTTRLVKGLVVYPAQLEHNLALTGGRCFSEGVLLALVKAGKPRQEAYVIVQRSAMKAYEGEGTFQELLAADPELAELISQEELNRCFTLEHALRHTGAIVERALAL